MAVWVRFWGSTRFTKKKNAAWTGPCSPGSYAKTRLAYKTGEHAHETNCRRRKAKGTFNIFFNTDLKNVLNMKG